MKKEIILCIVVIFVLAAVDHALSKYYIEYVVESYRKTIDNDIVADSLHYGSFNVEIVSKKEVKRSIDKKIASDIGVPRSSIESKMGLSVSTTDTVRLTQKTDSIYIYKDKWLDAKVNLYDSTMTYRARDSLSQYIERIYRHKFLFWKWGTKGYKVHIINHNPHTIIDYADYIRVGE